MAYTADSTAKVQEKARKICAEISIRKQKIAALKQPVSPGTPFVVSFVGRFKTGKSSLINALLGTELLPTKATTATAVVTRIIYGKSVTAFIREDGYLRSASLEDAREKILFHQGKELRNSTEVIFRLPIPWMDREMELRDTPGMDDGAMDGALDRLTLETLKDTDLCVLVYDAGQFLSGREKELTRKICSLLGGNVVFVINRTNMLNSPEAVADVEKLAETVFYGLGNNVAGCGKYYLTCSAPKMTELDGFDQWFKNRVFRENHDRDRLREIAARSKASSMEHDINTMKEELYGIVRLRSEAVRQEHHSRIEEKRRQLRNRYNEVLALLSGYKAQAGGSILTTDGLEDKLQELKWGSGWTDEYAANSRKVTSSFFKSRMGVLKWNKFVTERINSGCIDAFMGKLDFPDACLIYHKPPLVNGTTIAGAVLGFLVLGGPHGAAIGGAIGSRGAGGTYEDQSVQNTMSFVEDKVVPGLKLEIINMLDQIIQEKKQEYGYANRKCVSGLEDELKVLQHLMIGLQSYGISQDA